MKRYALAFVFLAFISGYSGYNGESLAADAPIPLLTKGHPVDWWLAVTVF